jgi:cytochrome c-type biogenesis protein CcmH
MRAALLALLLLLAAPVGAVEPGEMLADPGLEARARAISRDLRCPVCQGENIDDSGADIAADLRRTVRERLLAGDSDAQVIDYIVARYGEYVLFRPPMTGANLLLWTAGPIMLVLGLGLVWRAALRRRPASPAPLSADEAARLRDLLDG